MQSQVHFVSGLPRSGSTLLCAVLRQNPRFSASMTSPVSLLFNTLHRKMCGGEYGLFFDNARRANMLRGVIDNYYSDLPRGTVIFDTNRSWTGRMALLSSLYPDARIICCVRDIGWIIDSIERMLSKNPLQLSPMFNFQPGASVYNRIESLMNSDTGLIGQAWSTLREAWFGVNAHRLIIVPYDDFTSAPKEVLQSLYRELGETWFEHDFDNVVYDEPAYDAAMGMPGLHLVRPKVERKAQQPVIPPDLFAKYANSHFWEKRELNTRGITMLRAKT